MGELADLQHWMARVLRTRRALAKDEHITREATERLTGNDRLRPVEQAEIYREQFWLRHTSALLEDYPGLSGVIGQGDWERLVEEYLTSHAPDSWTLRDLGNRMTEHVESCAWLPHRQLCIDMARLEWSYTELFDARDAPPLDPNKLGSIPEAAWETALIVLNPALRLLRTEYPVAELRRRLREGEASALIPDAQSQNLVLFRSRKRSLHYDVVGDGAFALLEALRDGLPLVPACERAVERAPSEAKAVEVGVGQWFQEWGRLGWIVDVDVK